MERMSSDKEDLPEDHELSGSDSEGKSYILGEFSELVKVYGIG